ncbi:acyl-ACP--UDP-N-acetylglucosamine O-acyltransferase [Candidatus Sumerlaeota bacterium]|nr:acyl-ACP--UDP-N-acetylglucosamine O-acyltransferase [Candidatus Sumerlaeota bacterium]
MLSSQAMIHPTAVVDPTAELDEGVEIGPYAVIEKHARIGAGSVIGSSAYIGPWTTLGRDSKVYHQATIGSDSQAHAYLTGVRSYLIAGDGNTFREYCTLNRSSEEDGATRVGDGNTFMAFTHVAHDCQVGNNCILANSATIGGYVVVEDAAVLGGLVGVHQFCRIGAYCIIGSNSKINKDVLPFMLVDGHPARPYGVNVVGLRRNGFSKKAIREIRRAYRMMFLQGLLWDDVLSALRKEAPRSKDIASLLTFIEGTQRGVLRPRNKKGRTAK